MEGGVAGVGGIIGGVEGGQRVELGRISIFLWFFFSGATTRHRKRDIGENDGEGQDKG